MKQKHQKEREKNLIHKNKQTWFPTLNVKKIDQIVKIKMTSQLRIGTKWQPVLGMH